MALNPARPDRERTMREAPSPKEGVLEISNGESSLALNEEGLVELQNINGGLTINEAGQISLRKGNHELLHLFDKLLEVLENLRIISPHNDRIEPTQLAEIGSIRQDLETMLLEGDDNMNNEDPVVEEPARIPATVDVNRRSEDANGNERNEHGNFIYLRQIDFSNDHFTRNNPRTYPLFDDDLRRRALNSGYSLNNLHMFGCYFMSLATIIQMELIAEGLRSRPFTHHEVIAMYHMAVTNTFRHNGADVQIMLDDTEVQNTPLILNEMFRWFTPTPVAPAGVPIENVPILTVNQVDGDVRNLRDEHFDGRFHYTMIQGRVGGINHFILCDGRGQFLYNSSQRLVYDAEANNPVTWRGIRIIGRRRV
ncbi:MAG: hypothetical protein FWE37_03740, partial [Spirochaetaceae bacterium]|nr:hypothetical protein [Spirochaetaceae bacterium]